MIETKDKVRSQQAQIPGAAALLASKYDVSGNPVPSKEDALPSNVNAEDGGGIFNGEPTALTKPLQDKQPVVVKEEVTKQTDPFIGKVVKTPPVEVKHPLFPAVKKPA